MEYSCCVLGCKSNYKKDETSVTVFKFPSIRELRQKLLHRIYLESLTKLFNPQEYV